MLTWEGIVQDYIVKYSDKVKKTTKPVKDCFGISYFTYHKIEDSGKYTVLVDRPDFAEHYVSERIFLKDPYLRHPKVYESGVCLMESHGSEEYKETILKSGKAILKMDTAIIIIQKQENFVEFFGFTGNTKSSSLQSLYLNHPQVLVSFTSYFKEEMKGVLTRMGEEEVSLLELKGEDFLLEQPIYPEVDLESRYAYFKKIGRKNETERLSLRERQCLKLLLEGKSAKETASYLGLSSRTVEYYLENIKNKLSCWTKQELLKIAKNLLDSGLL